MAGVLATVAAAAALLAPPSGPLFRLGLEGTAPEAPGLVHLVLRAPTGGRVTVYAPAGWQLDTTRPTKAVVARGLVAGEPGTLAVARPGTPVCGPGPVATAWAWSGETALRVEVGSTPADERRVAYRIDICAPAPLTLDLAFGPGVFTNPAAVGLYTWRAVVGGGTRELQSQVPVPHVLSLRGTVRSGRLTIRGRLAFEGLAEEGARVVVSGGGTRRGAGHRVLGTVRTAGSGRFALRVRSGRAVRWIRARTLPRPAKCARPLAASCTGVVAPAFAPATRVGTS